VRGDPLRRRLREPVPVLPISGASCRCAGTAPARSKPCRRARTLGEERRSRAPRALSPHAWFRDVGEERPKRLARPYRAMLPLRLPVSRPSARRRWQSGPSDRGITAALRRERCDPAVTRRRRAPCGAPDASRDPSMVDVQPSCQRSAPGIRVGSPCPVLPELGWVSRFTPLHPLRPAARSPLRRSLPEGRSPERASGAPGASTDDRLCSDSHRGGPTPPSRPAA
jgi:hypothetical protein